MSSADPRAVAGSAPLSSHRTAMILLGAVIVVWGANWPIMKIALDSIAPLTFAAARLILGALTMIVVLGWRREFRLPTRADVPVVLSVGLLQLAGFLIFVNLGLLTVEAGRSAILSYTTMIWVTPAAVWLLGERMSRGKTFGVLCGIVGVAAMFNPLSFDWSDDAAVIGNAFLLGGALCWAIGILHVRGHRWRQSALVLSPWQMLVGLVPTAALALWFEHDQPIQWSGALVAVLAYNGPIATAFALWAWLSVNRSLPAIASSMGSLGVPAAGVVLSVLLLDEPVTFANLAGLGLITLGLVLVARETAREQA